MILIGRLFLLQVLRHDYYTELSQGNRVRIEPIPAARGLILDRNGEVIARQPAGLSARAGPRAGARSQQHAQGPGRASTCWPKTISTTFAARSARAAPFDSVPIRLRMSEEDIARFAVRRFEFPGVDIETRQTRLVPEQRSRRSRARLRRRDQRKRHRRRSTAQAYAGTSLIGKLGVEASYEKELHGTNGFREVLVNAQGRSVTKMGQLHAGSEGARAARRATT